MFLFIATIFIAELIIVLTLIAYIAKADKAVNNLYNDTVVLKAKVKEGLSSFRECVHIIKEKRECFTDFVQKKRNQFTIYLIKTILVYLLLHFLKSKCKRAAGICNWILLAKDVWDSVSA